MTTHPQVDVAAEVRAALGRKNVKPFQLARIIGMQQSTLSRRLSGHSDFTVPELAAISTALEVDFSYILPTPAALAEERAS